MSPGAPLDTPASRRRAESSARPLPVVFAVHDKDGGYWLNTAVALTSLAHHARRPISVHIIHDATLGEAARARLAEIARTMQVPLAFMEQSLPPGIDPRLLGVFSPASAFRLMIPSLFAEEDLVVYLDSDLVVNGVDVTDLIEAAPAEVPICAVAEKFVAQSARHRTQLDELGVAHERYFNSGVLALRPRLLAKDLVDRFLAFLTSGVMLVHPDQDFLNVTFGGQVHLLDERFNSAVGMYDGRTLKPLGFYDGRIVHYVGALKPLTGLMSPAFVPFLAHAFLVPEIFSGASYSPVTYLFPADGMPNAIRSKPMTHDPDAVTFYAQLLKADPQVRARLNPFLNQVVRRGGYPYANGFLEIRRRLGSGPDAVMAEIDMDGCVRTGASRAAARARARDDVAERYERAVAALAPGQALAHPTRFRLNDLLGRGDAWLAAMDDYVQALSQVAPAA